MGSSESAARGWECLVRGLRYHGASRRHGKSALGMLAAGFVLELAFTSSMSVFFPIALIICSGLAGLVSFALADEACRNYREALEYWPAMRRRLKEGGMPYCAGYGYEEQAARSILSRNVTPCEEKVTRAIWPWENPFSEGERGERD